MYPVRFESGVIDRVKEISSTPQQFIRDAVDAALRGPQRGTDASTESPVVLYLREHGACHRNRVMGDLGVSGREFDRVEHVLVRKGVIVSDGGVLGLAS